jgi:hypothetical protein
VSHNLTLLSYGTYGTLAICSCGWQSRIYRVKMGAQLAFGEHLVGSLSE